MLALRRSPIRVYALANNGGIHIQKRAPDILRKGEILHPIILQIVIENTASATRLVTVRSVREDVERIHGWPIDTEMMARLATVVILPLVIGVGVPFLVPHL